MKKMKTERRLVRGPQVNLAVYLQGDEEAPAVVFSHSILASSMAWDEQVALLAQRGYRTVCIDTRGHGASHANDEPCSMDDLALDTIAVLDALGIQRAHYVGLSLGGMSGVGLGLHHADRWLSLCLCAMRADAPPAVAAPWNERIALARQHFSCAPLAAPTIERWFGASFLRANPDIATRFHGAAATTQVDGFVACARAIQGLNYLSEAHHISLPTQFIVGANDGVLPEAMRDLQHRVVGSVLDEIPDAGHLPNIDQPQAFNEVLLRHLARCAD